MSTLGDYRKLINRAVSQGWKWKQGTRHNWLVAPSGHRHLVSKNPRNDYNLVLFRQDLIKEGLKLENHTEPRATTNFGEALSEAIQRPIPPISVDPHKHKTLEQLVEHVIVENKNKSMTVQEIVEKTLRLRSDSSENSIAQTVMRVYRKGFMTRLSRGTYIYRDGKPTEAAMPPPAAEPAPFISGMLTGDAHFDEHLKTLDEALVALSKIESVVRQHREVIQQFAVFKKMLGVK